MDGRARWLMRYWRWRHDLLRILRGVWRGCTAVAGVEGVTRSFGVVELLLGDGGAALVLRRVYDA